MKVFAETERLILREIVPQDVNNFFELDSNPNVHKYLGSEETKTIQDTEKMIEYIRQQYIENGIGRWAMIEKETGNFVGWTGLKLMKMTLNNHTNFYDVGYRLIEKYWGKGYATESAKASIKYGFEVMNLNEIIGITHTENKASIRALEKCGLKIINQFTWEEWGNLTCNWLSLTKEDWQKQEAH
jgi:ribosomal-protein-alanine N-acetyltransferase